MLTRTPTSATDRNRSEAGFTLIELLAVLAILAIAAALFSYRSQAGFGTAKFRALMTGTASGLREARAQAIEGARDQVFVVDTKSRTLSYREGGLLLKLPQGVELEAEVAEKETNGSKAGIRFYPDGTSTGGSLRFAWNGSNYTIDVNWLTGNVAISGL